MGLSIKKNKEITIKSFFRNDETTSSRSITPDNPIFQSPDKNLYTVLPSPRYRERPYGHFQGIDSKNSQYHFCLAN
jgi:hypothetical protein